MMRLVVCLMLVAAPLSAAEIFNGNTMLGWARATDPGVVAYAELPFHGGKDRAARPRAGFALTTPTMARIGATSAITDAPRTFDLRFSGANLTSDWHWSLRSDNAIAWSTDPNDIPSGIKGPRDRLFGGTGSWIAVGLLTAGAVAGVFLITEDDVPPPAPR